MFICTIAARNYLSRVAILAASFHRVHPDGRMGVCIIDDPDDTVDLEALGVERIALGCLLLDPSALAAMTLMYDVTELSTALKPWVLEAAMARAAGPALYLDPDIEVFASLAPLLALASRHGIVLTPHVLAPVPRDGFTPEEGMLLLAGLFNLGFLGASPAAGPFLDWWKERLRVDCVIEPDQGLFTDQRWVDFVPSLFPHTVSRDPGANVAYWNAHERPLTRDADGSLRAAGEPLRFLHYSGYDPAHPHLLSRHAAPRPRVRLSEHPVLRELCDRYGERLRGGCPGFG